jgi:hypothetical protein
MVNDWDSLDIDGEEIQKLKAEGEKKSRDIAGRFYGCFSTEDGQFVLNRLKEITLDRPACKVEVGLNFDVKIKTMPINQDFQDGPTLTRKKRIVRVTANVYETLGVRINGEFLVDRNFGMPIGMAVPPYTGTKTINLLGWSELAQIEITQTDPLPLTVLGIGLEVEA